MIKIYTTTYTLIKIRQKIAGWETLNVRTAMEARALARYEAKGLMASAHMAALTNPGGDNEDMAEIHQAILGMTPLRLSDTIRSAEGWPSPPFVFRTLPRNLCESIEHLFDPDTPTRQPQPQPQDPTQIPLEGIELPPHPQPAQGTNNNEYELMPNVTPDDATTTANDHNMSDTLIQSQTTIKTTHRKTPFTDITNKTKQMMTL